jgi:hypothetical protein
MSLFWSLEVGKLHPVSEMVIAPSEFDVVFTGEFDVGFDVEFDGEFEGLSGVMCDVELQDDGAALAGARPFCSA